MRAFDVEQDALEPSLAVGAAGFVVGLPVDAPAIDDQLGERANQLGMMFDARGRELD